MRKFLFLGVMQPFGDFALLLLRLFVGFFLIWGVWDNITDPARMAEFVGFLGKFGFAQPKLMAVLSVYAQLLIGIAFVLGLFTRWAGILCIINFVVAIVMVDRLLPGEGPRNIFPSGCLVAIGLYLATYGAGRLSADAVLKANEMPRSNGGVRLKK
jgi:putative oxidoreductase